MTTSKTARLRMAWEDLWSPRRAGLNVEHDGPSTVPKLKTNTFWAFSWFQNPCLVWVYSFLTQLLKAVQHFPAPAIPPGGSPLVPPDSKIPKVPPKFQISNVPSKLKLNHSLHTLLIYFNKSYTNHWWSREEAICYGICETGKLIWQTGFPTHLTRRLQWAHNLYDVCSWVGLIVFESHRPTVCIHELPIPCHRPFRLYQRAPNHLLSLNAIVWWEQNNTLQSPVYTSSPELPRPPTNSSGGNKMCWGRCWYSQTFKSSEITQKHCFYNFQIFPFFQFLHLSHNIYVMGHLFSRPWVCRGLMLEFQKSTPPRPEELRYCCCYVLYRG